MFKKSKDLAEIKVTDLTLGGQPIVLGKKRGRPPIHKVKNPDWFPLEKRIQAAAQFAVLGDLQKTSELTDIPVSHLRKFMQEEWWHEVMTQIHREENEKITSKMTVITTEILDALLDRVQNGDVIIDRKTGEEIRVPVRMKDLSLPISTLIDKRQLLRGEATSRTERIDTEDRLEKLAKKFKSFTSARDITSEVTVIQFEDTNGPELQEGIRQLSGEAGPDQEEGSEERS